MAKPHVLGSSLLFCLFLHTLPTAVSVSEADALLKLKASFVNSSLLDSWKPGTDPCDLTSQWLGIICVDGLVSSIRLKNLGLSGRIDIDALESLSALRSVGFVSNSFTGPIPDFNRMGLLKGLYLSRNKFSGEIPSDYFKPMAGLKKVWLSGNMFTGRIPTSLLNLSHLMELRIDNNKFSGTIPQAEVPSLVILDVSYNKLEGDIPSGLSGFGPNTFKGNARLCGNQSNACNIGSIESSPNVPLYSSNSPMSMWIMVAAAVMFFVMVIGIFVLKRRQDGDEDECTSFHISSVRRTEGVTSREAEIAQIGDPSSRKGSKRFGRGVEIVMINDEKGEFTMNDLMKAAADVLANGALSSTYKAVMLNGMSVVVKRIKEGANMEKEQFDREMRSLGCLRHNNLLTPLAYHFRKDEKLLVFEYIPKGSLLYLLHGDRGLAHAELNWPTRLKIIEGIARGLVYLHTELSELDLPHGNLKSSNVLLNEDNEPMLTEYGLSLVISSSFAAQSLAAYKAPEAITDLSISPKCDVYCLGIIILEILTGKFPAQFVTNGEGGVDAVQWVRSAIAEGREADVYDPDIERTERSKDEMNRLIHIGAACTESNPVQRLDMGEVVRRIEDITMEGRSHDITTIQVEGSID